MYVVQWVDASGRRITNYYPLLEIAESDARNHGVRVMRLTSDGKLVWAT